MLDESRPQQPASRMSDERSIVESSTDRAGTAHSPALARFYMTSDLRAATGLTRTHLDFYLRENVIVPTARTESGYLLFDDDELALLRQVIAWRQDGVGVREIRMRLGRASEGDVDGGGQ
ncbi:MAG: MerR family transcriptional regulator [Chloroflexota bacterium]|nr:MerR family transcriptional regulator [Chloroflexota bacterium]